MTIKKTLKVKPTGSPTPAAAEPASPPTTGGATIADRFKLDLSDPGAKQKSSGGKAAACTVAAGLVALAAAGILAYLLWQHWEFLMPA
ncbi:MAG: hypothetical protein ACI4RD_08540 [Kiritimatiellia bacterium]